MAAKDDPYWPAALLVIGTLIAWIGTTIAAHRNDGLLQVAASVIGTGVSVIAILGAFRRWRQGRPGGMPVLVAWLGLALVALYAWWYMTYPGSFIPVRE